MEDTRTPWRVTCPPKSSFLYAEGSRACQLSLWNTSVQKQTSRDSQHTMYDGRNPLRLYRAICAWAKQKCGHENPTQDRPFFVGSIGLKYFELCTSLLHLWNIAVANRSQSSRCYGTLTGKPPDVCCFKARSLFDSMTVFADKLLAFIQKRCSVECRPIPLNDFGMPQWRRRLCLFVNGRLYSNSILGRWFPEFISIHLLYCRKRERYLLDKTSKD